MAIIKCPECGHPVSDKAPTCPNCGVEIEGKVTKCTQCGEVYLAELPACPKCRHSTKASVGYAEEKKEVPAEAVNVAPPIDPHKDKPTAKKSPVTLIVAFAIALALCAVGYYYYHNAQSAKEKEAYAYAMQSEDPLVLQTYLDTYREAPKEHVDAINNRLENLKKVDNDWTDALASETKEALEEYLREHPGTEHKAEANHKIDSIDWEEAARKNTIESYQLYVSQHSNGERIDEATTSIKQIKTKTILPEDKAVVLSALRKFFQSVNSRDEANLEASVATTLTRFLGKVDAGKVDVVTFMNKIYKEDVTNMNWRLGNDMKIEKKEVGDEKYEYAVTVTANQSIERTDETKETEAKYRINARIDPDGLISEMNMNKILE